MAYIKLSIAQISKLEADYKLAKESLEAGNLAPKDERKYTKLVQEIPAQAAQRLENIIGKTEDYFHTHQTNAKNWLGESLSLLKNAQGAAARFRKDPTNQQEATYVENFAADILARKQRYDVDSQEFGAAWGDVRAFNATHLPKAAVDAFNTDRARIIGDQRAVLVMGNKIAEAAKQAEALKAIIAKASMKKDMKAGSEQRNIGVARTSAEAVATELAAALNNLLQNSMTSPAPQAIKTGSTQLVQVSKMKDYPATKLDWVTAHGFWQTVDQAQKNMLTKVAAMEKVLATRTRGFRSNELSDAKVKVELAKAAKSLKDAKAQVKLYASDYANAKKAHAVIEAKAKKLKFA